jgi:hypothetical protein
LKGHVPTSTFQKLEITSRICRRFRIRHCFIPYSKSSFQ